LLVTVIVAFICAIPVPDDVPTVALVTVKVVVVGVAAIVTADRFREEPVAMLSPVTVTI
jgi:hypothetical protein